MTDEQILAFAVLAGCQTDVVVREQDQALVMTTRYPVAVQEIRPGQFVVCEFRDQRLKR